MHNSTYVYIASFAPRPLPPEGDGPGGEAITANYVIQKNYTCVEQWPAFITSDVMCCAARTRLFLHFNSIAAAIPMNGTHAG